MAKRLENLTARPVLLTLASGETLRLSPRETSQSLEDVEVSASAKVEKLVTAGVLFVHELRRSTAARAGAKPPAPSEVKSAKAKKGTD